MPFRFATLLIIASLALAALVMQSLPTQQPALSVPRYALPSVAENPDPDLLFRDVTLDWQVVAAHQQTDEQLSALTETLGSGVCAIDANKDGWIDLFFVGGSGHTRHYGRKSWWHVESGNRLLLNNDGEYFTDVTAQAGLENPQWGMACAVGDLDNNGWPDLIVTGVSSNRIYSNSGNAVFVDVTDTSGIAPEHWSTGASLGDYNNDSLVDVYVTNYVAFNKGARTFERNKGFVTTKVAFDATLYDPLPNKLYLNQGDFKFTDTTESAGVQDALGRSLGARWIDLNRDGWLDLIVINDVDSPSQVYLNDNGTRFIPSESHYSLIETPESRDLLEEDFDNDGLAELLITQNGGAAPILAARANEGMEKFTDRAWDSGIADRRNLNIVNWGAASGDFNNDGKVDLFIANGGFMPDIDSPYVAQPQHNQLFWGLGNGEFIPSPAWDGAVYPLSSRAAITADLNNDGNLELVISNNNDPLQIFESTSPNQRHWIGLDLYGKNTYAQVSGARITLTTSDSIVHRTVRSRQGFLSSGDDRLHIGLGDAADSVDLTIDWPDGTQSKFRELASDAYYLVDKAAGSISPSLAVLADKSPFASTIGDYDDSARIILGELLLQMATTESDRQFSQLWASSSDSVKTSLLDTISHHWDSTYLRYLRQAVDSGSDELKLQAIDMLGSLELEYSIPWLIPLLSDDSQLVNCATANTLQFFFDEEEAVTHRKYLSVAPLVRLLESGEDEAAVCAANALAAAESQRAVLPLIAQIHKRRSEELQLASIRALGLIRDNQAQAVLAGIVGAPQDHSAPVIAESLIALVRLNDQHIASYLDSIFTAEQGRSQTSKLQQHRIANSLMANKETIVFPKQKLRKKIENLLAQNSLRAIDVEEIDSQLAIAILDSIKLSQMAEYQFFAERMLGKADSAVRKNAYKTLSVLSSDWQSELLPKMLDEESPELVHDVITAAGGPAAMPYPGLIKNLDAQASPGELSAADFGVILDSISTAGATQLLTTLYTGNVSERSHEAMLDLCDTHSPKIVAALSSPDHRQTHSLEYLYQYCLYSEGSHASRKSSQGLADRLVLKKALESADYSTREKQRLVIRASSRDRVTAETMLLNSVESYSGDDLLHAITVLFEHQLTERMAPFLWGLLKDVDTPLTIRFEAAKMLLPLERSAVNEYVNSEFLAYAAS